MSQAYTLYGIFALAGAILFAFRVPLIHVLNFFLSRCIHVSVHCILPMHSMLILMVCPVHSSHLEPSTACRGFFSIAHLRL